jgi:hypothetical protein
VPRFSHHWLMADKQISPVVDFKHTDCRECRWFELRGGRAMLHLCKGHCNHPNRNHPHDPDAFDWCGDWEPRE